MMVPTPFLAPASDGRRGGQPAGGSERVRSGRQLDGMRVLLVEDDLFVGLETARIIEELGGTVIGPAISLRDAVDAARKAAGQFDAAVLDVNLHGEYTFALAAELSQRGIPVVFVTAYAAEEDFFPPEIAKLPRIGKPLRSAQLARTLGRGPTGTRLS
jgi:CheY-like chemotaxis protein